MADSLKLSLAAVILYVVAWSGALARFQAPVAQTAGFLLYYLWPAMSLVIGGMIVFFAVRDARKGSRWQAAAAVILALGMIAASWTQFHGSE